MPSAYHDLTNDTLTYLTNRSFADTETNDPTRAWFPGQQTGNMTYALESLSRRGISVAAYRAPGTPAKIASRHKAGGVTVRDIPPVSIKIGQGEQELINMRALANASQATQDAFINDAVDMGAAVAARFALARVSCLVNASVAFTEEDGFDGVIIDYGRDAALEVTAGTVWSDAAATILDDVADWHTTYALENGPAAAILVSQTTLANILSNTQVNDYLAFVGAQSGGSAVPAALTQWLQARGLPPFAVVDHRIKTIDSGFRSIWPDDAAVFVPSPSTNYGAMVWTDTIQARDVTTGARGDYGLTTVSWDEREPIETWTRSAAFAVPATGNPNATMKATI